MKLIGKSEKGFIIDASEDEVAHIMGEYCACCETTGILKVGDEINVSDMYYKLHDLDSEISALKQANKSIAKFLKRYE